MPRFLRRVRIFGPEEGSGFHRCHRQSSQPIADTTRWGKSLLLTSNQYSCCRRWRAWKACGFWRHPRVQISSIQRFFGRVDSTGGMYETFVFICIALFSRSVECTMPNSTEREQILAVLVTFQLRHDCILQPRKSFIIITLRKPQQT